MNADSRDERPTTKRHEPTPTQIGRYQIVGRLGGGGMATVYDGYDASVNRYVAVKLLHAWFTHRGDVVEVFLQEARKVARLERHDGILTVYEVGQHERSPFIAMQKIDGAPLDALLMRNHGVLPCETVRQVFATVGSALAFAHERGIVHCDIKPSNILIERCGRAFLTDFGISRARPDRLGVEVEGLPACTPRYASPEQLREEATDPRSDIYSLGVVLYEMCTGTTPFGDCVDLDELITAVHDDAPLAPSRLNPHVPAALDRAILRALAKSPQDRYAKAADFVRDVLAATDDDMAQGDADAWARRPKRLGRRRLMLPALLGTALLVSAGVAIVQRGHVEGAGAGARTAAPQPAAASPSTTSTRSPKLAETLSRHPLFVGLTSLAHRASLWVHAAWVEAPAALAAWDRTQLQPPPQATLPARASWEAYVEQVARVPWWELMRGYLARGQPSLAPATWTPASPTAPPEAVPRATVRAFADIQREAAEIKRHARRKK